MYYTEITFWGGKILKKMQNEKKKKERQQFLLNLQQQQQKNMTWWLLFLQCCMIIFTPTAVNNTQIEPGTSFPQQGKKIDTIRDKRR